MELSNEATVYVKDALIDRIFNINSKITDIEVSLISTGKNTPFLVNHLANLKQEAKVLDELKANLEQSLYNSAHNVS